MSLQLHTRYYILSVLRVRALRSDAQFSLRQTRRIVYVLRKTKVYHRREITPRHLSIVLSQWSSALASIQYMELFDSFCILPNSSSLVIFSW